MRDKTLPKPTIKGNKAVIALDETDNQAAKFISKYFRFKALMEQAYFAAKMKDSAGNFERAALAVIRDTEAYYSNILDTPVVVYFTDYDDQQLLNIETLK